MKLNDLNLHDSALLELIVGVPPDDGVRIRLDYIESYATQEVRARELVFTNCWRVDMRLNYGVLNRDSIMDASEIPNSPLVDAVSQTLARMGVTPPNLRHFRIETAITASVLDIVAQDVELR